MYDDLYNGNRYQCIFNGNLYYGFYNGNLYYGIYNGDFAMAFITDMFYYGFYNGNLYAFMTKIFTMTCISEIFNMAFITEI